MHKHNSKSFTVHLENIGLVEFRRNTQARNLNIRIKPFSGVHVSVPKGMSFKKAEEIVRNKTGWITRHLKKMQDFERNSILYDGTKELTTRAHKLHIEAGDIDEIVVRLSVNLIRICYPERYEITHPEVQSAIWAGLIAAYRKEAKEYLPKRVEHLARLHRFKYRRVFIKNHRSRWGSCSAVNNINLSLHLMRLPDELIDYVILHELVHTEIKNHSPAFWTRLQEVCPNVKILRKRLRDSSMPFVM